MNTHTNSSVTRDGDDCVSKSLSWFWFYPPLNGQQMKTTKKLLLLIPAIACMSVVVDISSSKLAESSYNNQLAQLDLWGGFWMFFYRAPYNKWNSASTGVEG